MKNAKNVRNGRIFSVGAAARFCGVTNTTVLSWIRQGHIQAYPTVGGHFRIRQDDLVMFMKKFRMTIPDELKKARVLVVDDNARILRLIRGSLLGYMPVEMFTTDNGYEACILAGDVKPDVMILDLVLPGMDGFEVCRRLKANSATRDIKIIVISGSVDDKVAQKALQRGAECFLRKPLDVDVLRQTVQKYIA